MTLAHRDIQERRYDGPIPPAAPATRLVPAAQRARLFQRLAGETREQTALRRTRLPGSAALADRRLSRLARDLRLYRNQGLVWRG